MCGIAGIWGVNFSSRKQLLESGIKAMNSALIERGPDDQGVYLDKSEPLGLGHTRLSILDLSKAGSQPMQSCSSRYSMTYNGEIYNHLEIRHELSKQFPSLAWKGTSDTETLIEAIDRWGIEPTLDRCVGMFAIALWDKKSRQITLIRDRFGEKPLYYGWTRFHDAKVFAFASDLKAFRALNGFCNPVSQKALGLYFKLMNVPAPLSIYEDIYKLSPGGILTIKNPNKVIDPEAAYSEKSYSKDTLLDRWWRLSSISNPREEDLYTDESAMVEDLDRLIGQSVKQQMLSDAPLGAFLSGGIDSTLVVSKMQEFSSGKVKTFTLGFDSEGYDESQVAESTANRLDTEHTNILVKPSEALAVIPKLSEIYSEPFADSSQIPTYLISKAASESVKVALTGDGGDENFGGYNRYTLVPTIWKNIKHLPIEAKNILSASIASVPAGLMERNLKIAERWRIKEKLEKLSSAVRDVNDIEDIYINLISVWSERDGFFSTKDSSAVRDRVNYLLESHPSYILKNDQARLMYLDSLDYLPNDILCKVDRASMSTSLETRAPFLDHRVAEAAWRIPKDLKIQSGRSKWPLRRLLYNKFPREHIDRTKIGFSIPVGRWLSGPLRDWSESLIRKAIASDLPFLDSHSIKKIWSEHLSGRRDSTNRIWTLLMYQQWMEDQRG